MDKTVLSFKTAAPAFVRQHLRTKKKINFSLADTKTKNTPGVRSDIKLLVTFGASKYDVDPNSHGLGAWRHQMVRPFARFDTKRQFRIG